MSFAVEAWIKCIEGRNKKRNGQSMTLSLALHLSIGEGELSFLYLRMWRALGPIGLTGLPAFRAS
jgi:hypothetical protein